MGQLRFLGALWKANLLAAMEYRGAFLSQVLGMALNNAIYFTFWVLFFDRFPAVRSHSGKKSRGTSSPPRISVSLE